MTKSDHSIYQDKELKCIWMEAGFVTYKLCDRDYRCEECPFDAVMRQHAATKEGEKKSATVSESRAVQGKRQGIADAGARSFEQALEVAFAPFRDVELPGDRLYHRNHIWIQKDETQCCRVGIDHVGASFLRTIASVVVPHIPVWIERDAPCAWVVHREGAVTLHSPVSGTILQSNQALKEHPHLINDSPYNEGWILCLAPDDFQVDLQLLLSPAEATSLFRAELVALRKEFLDLLQLNRPAVGRTLYDGGFPLENIQEMLGIRKYFEIVSRIFEKRA